MALFIHESEKLTKKRQPNWRILAEIYNEKVQTHEARVAEAMLDPVRFVQRHGKAALDDLRIKPREGPPSANYAGKGKGWGKSNGKWGQGKGSQKQWQQSSSNAHANNWNNTLAYGKVSNR